MHVYEIDLEKLFDDFQESVSSGKNPNFFGWPNGEVVLIERKAAELIDLSESQFEAFRKRLNLSHICVGSVIAYNPEQLRSAIIEIYAEKRRAQSSN